MLHFRRFTLHIETIYPLYKSLRGSQGRSGQVRKISPPSGPFFLFYILLYSVCTSFWFLCFDCPAFCVLSLLYNTHNTASMPPAAFELATPASDRSQILALDRSATGIGRIRSPGRPARSESLYRQSYRGPQAFYKQI